MPLSCMRADFDIPEDVAYLNSAYMGPLSRRVLEAGRSGLAAKAQPWNISQDDFFTTIDEVRERFADVVGGDADGVALLPSVSYGTATAARNLRVGEGQTIVVLAEQFPSNVYVWRDLARRRGAAVVTVAYPSDRDWTSSILETIDSSTAVVAVPNCHWTDGTVIDLRAVSERAREIGAALVVDGSQSIGAVPFDIATVQPDFVVTGTYKWLLGPYSQAMMWVAPEHRRGRPLESNWITRINSRDFSTLADYTDQIAPGARRYDVGEVSNFGLIPASLACLEQTLDWGVEAIEERIGSLTEYLIRGASELDLGIPPRHSRSQHMVGLRLKGRDPRPLVERLSAAKVYVSVRADSIRVSPHVFNDLDDIARLLGLLADFVGSSRSATAPAPEEAR